MAYVATSMQYGTVFIIIFGGAVDAIENRTTTSKAYRRKHYSKVN